MKKRSQEIRALPSSRLFLRLGTTFVVVLLVEYLLLNPMSAPATSESRLLEASSFEVQVQNTRRNKLGLRFNAKNQFQNLLEKSHTREELSVLDLPHSNQTEGRIIYYLHIHKSAGSTICSAARGNGLHVADTNCNVQRDQRCCGWSDELDAQKRYATTTHYTFVANERDMYEAMDPEHYRYVVTLRKSKDRYLSHWKHVVRWNFPAYLPTFSSWWKDQPDNWNFRKICGTACLQVPKYQISEYLFADTVRRLERFEDILLFERFNQSFAVFAQRVGWTKMPTSIGKKKNVTYPDSGDEWDPMMSILDDALYELAEARLFNVSQYTFPEATLERLQTYFTSEKGKACTSVCCAHQCSKY
jgi:hypothetical protein